jgi:hypothetical protein
MRLWLVPFKRQTGSQLGGLNPTRRRETVATDTSHGTVSGTDAGMEDTGRFGLALGLALLVFALAPTGAQGAILRLEEQTFREGPNTFTVRSLVYEAAAGEANETTISRVAGRFVITDRGAMISAEAPCTSIGPSEAACSASGVRFVRVLAHDFDDVIVATDVGETAIYALGGAGDDTIGSGVSDDLLSGGPGDDTLAAGAGRDFLDGGQGADMLRGGPETDYADYSRRANALRIDLDGRADDGEPGEGDNVHTDVEGVVAGTGDDLLVGNGKHNVFNGSGGDDTIRGRADQDVVFGGAGNDRLSGGMGVDWLNGESGDDVLVGGPRSDALFAHSGRDRIFARDGVADAVIDGGPGRDRACVDQGLDKPAGVEVLCPDGGGPLAG